jgi:hypothetical protein
MAVIAGRDERAWGRVWHTPSGPARTQREAVGDLARMAGAGPVPVRAIPAAVMRSAGLFSPLLRELAETRYQFSEDFVMDSSAAQRAFGLEPTPWDSVLAAVLRSYGWQGTDRGTDQGEDQGEDQGTDRGTDQGADQGMDQGADQGADQGTDQGADQRR